MQHSASPTRDTRRSQCRNAKAALPSRILRKLEFNQHSESAPLVDLLTALLRKLPNAPASVAITVIAPALHGLDTSRVTAC
jgi:hypothetical protein